LNDKERNSKVKPESVKPGDGADRTLDVLHFERDSLSAIFAPKSVAVIGATEQAGRVGRTVLWNLISNPFGGTVYPINKRHKHVLGIKAYADIAGVPEPVDGERYGVREEEKQGRQPDPEALAPDLARVASHCGAPSGAGVASSSTITGGAPSWTVDCGVPPGM